MKRVTLALTAFVLLTSAGLYATDRNIKEDIQNNQIYHNQKIIFYEKVLPNNIKHDIMISTTQKVKDTTPYYKIPMNKELQKYIFEKCKKANISYELVLGLIKTESNFKADLIHKNSNGTKDYGLCQINTCRLKDFYKVGYTDIMNPYQNVEFAINLLNQLKNKSDEHMMLISYNMGESTQKKLASRGIYSTRYSRKVLNNKNELR